MKRVQVFLRAPLFTTRTTGHIPRKAMILDGEVQEQETVASPSKSKPGEMRTVQS